MDEKFIYPNYQESSIANIPATIAALLDVPFEGLPPLRHELWQPLTANGKVRHVVLLLVDGMGLNLLRQAEVESRWLFDNATCQGTITSIFPSTTVAALSSLWTGVAPAQHGLVGFQIFLPEYAVIGQMLKLSPTFDARPNGLLAAGLEPETFLQAPGFAEQLAAHGVKTSALKHYGIVNSALSQMHGRGVARNVGTVGAADTIWQIRHLLENEESERSYIMGYWSDLDTLGHMHGYNHPTVITSVQAFLELVRRELWDSLSPARREDTVLLITADHGQVNTPLEQQIYLEDHPRLQNMLLMRPAGEPRTLFLYTKHGCHEAVMAYFKEHLAHAAEAMDTEQALADRLLGPPPHSPVAQPRLGDVIVTMREGYVLMSRNEPPVMAAMRGRHGGLTADEMQVPWFAFRFDQ